MVTSNPLKRLRDLDREFHRQLIDILRGDEYRDAVPNLQNEDLAWLVGFLDNVNSRVSFLRSVLKPGVGPRWHLRSYKHCILRTTARARKDMRSQECVTEIVYSFGGRKPSACF